MARTTKPPDPYAINSNLVEDPHGNAVISSFSIDLGINEKIKFDTIETHEGTFSVNGSRIDGFITAISYNGFTESPASPRTEYYEHNVNGFPHEVTITVKSPGGNVSTVTDMAL